MSAYFAEHALLPDGWATRVRIEVDAKGGFASVQADADATGAVLLAGPVLPGMPSLHSHAFQRAMAGLTETRGAADDDFWSWRELMYRFVGRLDPRQALAVARHLYIEMLKCGYTAVAEFHYVHNTPDGTPYARPAELSLAHVQAAREAGIAITLMPSLYTYGNFGGRPLAPRQARFHSDATRVLELVAAVRAAAPGDPEVLTGVAPHSLRAVDLDGLQDLIAGLQPASPIHIHVAEQTREVEDSVAFSGQRPVEWLLEHLPVDRRWCLVHATHLNAAETASLARSGAVAGLCPSTEGNLGDGIFPMQDYRKHGGRWGIGGDSHVCRDPFEELRLLEYVQRLVERRRNLTTGRSPAVGTTLWLEACAGGAQALGRNMGALRAGARADLVVLDGGHVDIQGRSGDAIANTAIFAGAEAVVRDVMVAGRWPVREGRHAAEASARSDYRDALSVLLA
jgi:formimidoylglutamate deiminase